MERQQETVIFACVYNAGRSQMAAALFNAMADPARARAISAGTQPGDRVHPVVVDAMREVDLDLSQNRPQTLTDAAGARRDDADHDGVRRRVPRRARSSPR